MTEKKPEPPKEVWLYTDKVAACWWRVKQMPPKEVEKLGVTLIGHFVPATALDELREQLEAAEQAHETTKRTVVNVIGGEVEGAPTHTLNYLQRLRELVDKEQQSSKGLEFLGRLNEGLSEPLPCGHPLECWEEREPGNERCLWCEDKKRAEAAETENKRLTAIVNTQKHALENANINAEHYAKKLAEVTTQRDDVFDQIEMLRRRCGDDGETIGDLTIKLAEAEAERDTLERLHKQVVELSIARYRDIEVLTAERDGWREAARRKADSNIARREALEGRNEALTAALLKAESYCSTMAANSDDVVRPGFRVARDYVRALIDELPALKETEPTE